LKIHRAEGAATMTRRPPLFDAGFPRNVVTGDSLPDPDRPDSTEENGVPKNSRREKRECLPYVLNLPVFNLNFIRQYLNWRFIIPLSFKTANAGTPGPVP
jgi:hypothetical protein